MIFLSTLSTSLAWMFLLTSYANASAPSLSINPNVSSPGDVLVLNSTPISIASPLNMSNLTTNADWFCYDTAYKPYVPSPLEPIVMNDCVTLIYNMLRVSDNTEVEWRNQVLPKWRLGTCNVWLTQRDARRSDTFPEIDIAWVAAKTVDTCVTSRAGVFGGWMSIGYKRRMTVKVFGRPPPV